MKCCKRPGPRRHKGKRSRRDFKSVTARARLRLKGSFLKETCNKRETHWTWPSKEVVFFRFNSQAVISLIRGREHSKKIAKADWSLPTDLPWTRKLLCRRTQLPSPLAWTGLYR